jgi:hypothetical protein
LSGSRTERPIDELLKSCRLNYLSSPNSATTQDWRSVFWCQNRCIVFNAVSPTFTTDIDESKHLSMIVIQLRFATFKISPLNIQLLKVSCLKFGLLHLTEKTPKFSEEGSDFEHDILDNIEYSDLKKLSKNNTWSVHCPANITKSLHSE